MLGIEYPILSAGMGPSLIGETTGAPAELVVAVSEAGGLGVLGGAGYTVETLRDEIRTIKAQTDKPFGVDLLLPADIVAKGDAPYDGPRQVPVTDALALLPEEHRRLAPRLHSVLVSGEPVEEMAAELEAAGFEVDYVEKWGQRVLGAVRIGKVRLIDNVEI